MKDTYNDNKAVRALSPDIVTADTKGPAVDLRGFGSVLFVITTGAIAGAGDFGVKLQESDTTTDGDFTDVAAADRLGTLPATLAANSAYRVGYIGSKRKRYVCLVATKAGGTSIGLSAVAILGHPALALVPA